MDIDTLINAGILLAVGALLIGGIVLFVRRCNGDENAD
jgi:hypothetical protein